MKYFPIRSCDLCPAYRLSLYSPDTRHCRIANMDFVYEPPFFPDFCPLPEQKITFPPEENNGTTQDNS